MDVPAIVRSTHTWDTTPGRDLRQGEEAIVIEARDEDGWSLWTLITIDHPRLIRLHTHHSVQDVLKKWLRPA